MQSCEDVLFIKRLARRFENLGYRNRLNEEFDYHGFSFTDIAFERNQDLITNIVYLLDSEEDEALRLFQLLDWMTNPSYVASALAYCLLKKWWKCVQYIVDMMMYHQKDHDIVELADIIQIQYRGSILTHLKEDGPRILQLLHTIVQVK